MLSSLAQSFRQDLEELTALDDDDEETLPQAPRENPDRRAGAADTYVNAVQRLTTAVAAVAINTFEKNHSQLEKQSSESFTSSSERREPRHSDGGAAERIVLCNQMVASIDVDILNLYALIKEVYQKRLPELASVVTTPLEYVQTVQQLGNNVSLSKNDLSGILSNSAIMAVQVSCSMTTGIPLSSTHWDVVVRACDVVLKLAKYREAALRCLQNHISGIAPNLTALVGYTLAAQFVAHANGLENLSRMPSCNIPLLGATGTTALIGGRTQNYSSGGPPAQGVLYAADIVQATPTVYRKKAVRLLGGKVSLAARIDFFGKDPMGESGREYRSAITTALSRMQEPPPRSSVQKALPIPEDKPSKKRGGRRHRKMKEKFRFTPAQKRKNRMHMDAAADVLDVIEGGEIDDDGVA